MPNFHSLKPPTSGTSISRKNGQLVVPDDPIIPYIEGDGTGPDIWRASVRVFDASVQKAYGGKRRLAWFEILAGEKAKNLTGEWLPNDTLEAVKAYKVAIKGPLTTPVGGGIRSLNVTLRQVLDLYSCIRPVRYFDGTPASNGPRARRRPSASSSSCRKKWESGWRRIPGSASNRSPKPAPSGWCGWRCSTRSRTTGRRSRSCTRATS